MFFTCSGKNYISDLGKKIGRSANKEEVSPLTADIRQLITKKTSDVPLPSPSIFPAESLVKLGDCSINCDDNPFFVCLH